VHVGNLSDDVDIEALCEVFKDCGKITSVHLGGDRKTWEMKGYAFIKFDETEATGKAVAVAGIEIMCRPYRVEHCTPEHSLPPSEKQAWSDSVHVENLSDDVDIDSN